MHDGSIQDTIVVVARATGGIGRAICLRLASRGATIVAIARNKGNLDQLESEIASFKANCLCIQADLVNPAQWEDVAARVDERFHKVDLFVNCIGGLFPGALCELQESEIEQIVRLNFMAAVYGTRTILPLMRARGAGHIITIGSLGGIIPMPFQSMYGAAKAAVRAFCLSVASELRGSGIAMSLIEPGPVRTGMLDMESRDARAAISFATRPLSAGRVADAVEDIIRHPKPEVILPRWQAPLAFLMHAVPGLFARWYPLLRWIGTARLTAYRAAIS
jgi:short-subunit dehydrogenase